MKRQTNVNSMKDQKLKGPGILPTLFLSWFYIGKLPKAPGTFGSLATLPLIYFLFSLHVNIYSLITCIILLYLIAVIVTERVQKQFHLHDPQWIVIDEVIGMLITWSFVMDIEPSTIFLVFCSFRMFDITKIWPASYFDKLHHGFGTITDDVISGLYAGIFTFLVHKFL